MSVADGASRIVRGRGHRGPVRTGDLFVVSLSDPAAAVVGHVIADDAAVDGATDVPAIWFYGPALPSEPSDEAVLEAAAQRRDVSRPYLTAHRAWRVGLFVPVTIGLPPPLAPSFGFYRYWDDRLAFRDVDRRPVDHQGNVLAEPPMLAGRYELSYAENVVGWMCHDLNINER